MQKIVNKDRKIYRYDMQDGVPVSQQVFTERHSIDTSGQDNPNYRRDIASGKSAVNNLDKKIIDERLGILTTQVTNYGQLRQNSYTPLHSASFDNELQWDPIPKGDFENIALRKAITKIRKSRETDFNGFVFLGELRSTLEFLRSPYKKLRTTLVNFQKDSRKSIELYRRLQYLRAKRRITEFNLAQEKSDARVVRSLKRDLNNSFLETMYGLRPVMSDVQNIARVAADLNNVDDIVRQFSQEKTLGSRLYVPAQVPLEAAWFRPTYLLSIVRKSKWTVGVFREGANEDLLGRLHQASQFGVSEIPSAIWELIPWSWAVDSVLNIGSLLRLWTTDTRGVRYSAHTTVIEKRISLVSYSFSSSKGDFKVLEPPSYSGYQQKVTRRSELPNIAFEDLVQHAKVQIPPILNSLGFGSAILQRTYFRK